MKCRCGHAQCYICSKSVVGYDHFSDQPGRCHLYDDTERRLKKEVEQAKKRAIREVLHQNKDMTKNDLIVDKHPTSLREAKVESGNPGVQRHHGGERQRRPVEERARVRRVAPPREQERHVPARVQRERPAVLPGFPVFPDPIRGGNARRT
jgi:hypothetical protein